ncbi:calpain-like cysteine peptidase, partial [Trypanosoma rangeli SC58]
MALFSVLDEYRQICEERGLQPLRALEDGLATSPEKICLSLLVVSSRHFETLIALLERRDDIEKLDLSGIQIPVVQLVELFSVLCNGCVKELILKNVELGVQAGEALLKLCIAYRDLIHVELAGTFLPEFLEIAIRTQVEMNHLHYEEKMSYWQKAVGPETPRLWRWRFESWTEENQAEPVQTMLNSVKSVDLWDIARSVTEEGVLFTDKNFPPEKALKGSNVRWVRVSSLLTENKTQENCCVGEKPLYYAKYTDTRNLCAALNVVQQVHHLRKHLCVRRIPNLGLFAFRFFVKSSSLIIIVDDQIPFIDDEPAGIHHGKNSDDYWGCLVEKAFAKLYGGYDKISGVGYGCALSQLTGGVCFTIDWKVLRRHFTETELFRFLRDLTNSKKIIASQLIPRNAMEMESVKEKGIVPYMSYVVTATEALREEKSHLSYIVQLSCPNKLTSEDTIFFSHLKVEPVSSLPRYWIGFENCLTYFNKSCLLLWPQSDPWNNHKNVVEHICDCSGQTEDSSTFATNPSFLLTNMGKAEAEIMIVLRKRKEDIKCHQGWIQLHVHKGNDNGMESERRYDVCSRNALFCTEKHYDGEAALVIRLKENERLQLTASASSNCTCILAATASDQFQLNTLPAFYAYTIKGNLGQMDAPNSSLVLINNGQETVERLVVAISQEPLMQRTHSVGLELWINRNLQSEDDHPQFITEFRKDVLVVFNFSLSVKQNDIITFIPLAKRRLHKLSFSMTVFSFFPLQRGNEV